MTVDPYPPSPVIAGSTTFSVEEIVTAASNALPPFSSISKPAFVASG